jgi:predicted metal-binding membrane protein
MDGPQKMILFSLVTVAISGWAATWAFEKDMMLAMGGTKNALSLAIFTSIWTVGMAAMMFPAIVPMVALYNRFVNAGGTNQVSVGEHPHKTHSAKVILFVSCYLVVWSLTGIGLLLGWSEMMLLVDGSTVQSLHYVFASVLIISGIYQFTPLKSKCLGYCESPMSFFMKRWSAGTAGAVKMGLYHGLYCLGCCWPYFLLMVALGWMNLAWMALFAAMIFGEKIWSRGIWVARLAGAGFIVAGVLVGAGIVQVDPMMNMGSSMDGMSIDETPMEETMAETPMDETSIDAMLPLR